MKEDKRERVKKNTRTHNKMKCATTLFILYIASSDHCIGLGNFAYLFTSHAINSHFSYEK